MLQVLVDDWQMQCCGDPFGVGDVVEWLLVPYDDEQPVLGGGGGEVLDLTHREESHGSVPDGTAPTRGVVRRVRALFVEHVEDPTRPRTFVRVPGSFRVQERTEPVDGYEGDSPPLGQGPQLVGYVVDLVQT